MQILQHQADFITSQFTHTGFVGLESKIDIKDFNSMSISWIIISFFFEICDIGLKK
jgi:hypothetical protein